MSPQVKPNIKLVTEEQEPYDARLPPYGGLVLRPVSGLGQSLVVTVANQHSHLQKRSDKAIQNLMQSSTGASQDSSAEFKIESKQYADASMKQSTNKMMKSVETARVKSQNKTVVGLPKFEELKLDKKRDRVRSQLS